MRKWIQRNRKIAERGILSTPVLPCSMHAGKLEAFKCMSPFLLPNTINTRRQYFDQEQEHRAAEGKTHLSLGEMQKYTAWQSDSFLCLSKAKERNLFFPN